MINHHQFDQHLTRSFVVGTITLYLASHLMALVFLHSLMPMVEIISFVIKRYFSDRKEESEFRDRDPRTLQGNTLRDKMLQDFSYISLASSSSGSRGSFRSSSSGAGKTCLSNLCFRQYQTTLCPLPGCLLRSQRRLSLHPENLCGQAPLTRGQSTRSSGIRFVNLCTRLAG